MATKLAFDVLVGPITMAGETYADHYEDDDAPPELVRAASHAHAAGAVSVTEGLDLSDVQSQKDGEKAYADAQGTHDGVRWSGPWHDGNVASHELQKAYGELAAAEAALDAANGDLHDWSAKHADAPANHELLDAVSAAEKAVKAAGKNVRRVSREIDETLMKGGDPE